MLPLGTVRDLCGRWRGGRWISWPRASRAQLERLEELKDPHKRRKPPAEAPLKKSDAMTKMLEKATPALAKPLQPKNEAELGKLKTKLANAGFRGEAAGSIFLGLKFVGLVAGLFSAAARSRRSAASTRARWCGPSPWPALLFYLPDLVVGFIGSSRKQAIFLALPDALDLMVVCVEAGLGLDQAMRKVAEEMKRTYRVLAEEFAMTNFQLQMGRPRAKCSTNWACGPACPTCGPWRRCSSRPTNSARAWPRRCACRAIRCASAAGNWPRKRRPRRPSN